MNHVHGHEVMQMIVNSNQPFTKESLIKTIVNHFGEDTRFFSCSQANMTAEDIVAFFESKGKFTFSEHGLVSNPGSVCNH